MIRHVVTFVWTDETTAEDVDEITQRLRALPGRIPQLRSYAVGPDIGIGGNADFAIVAEFEDVAGFVAYRDHPEHVAVATECIAPCIATRFAVQFETRG